MVNKDEGNIYVRYTYECCVLILQYIRERQNNFTSFLNVFILNSLNTNTSGVVWKK